MSLKHPEMLESPVKRSCVLSTERDGRQCGCQETCLLMNHCTTESVRLIRLGDSVSEVKVRQLLKEILKIILLVQFKKDC